MPTRPKFLHASSKVAAATFLTRIFGMLRDISVAYLFGASAALDAFFVAFKIANFLRRLFAEGAFAQGLVPVLSASQQRTELFQSLLAGTLLIGGLLTLIAECFAPFWIHCLAPGFIYNSPQFLLTVDLFRITFPFLFFVLMTALFGAALNVNYCFGWPAITPVWLNLATLVAAWGCARYFAIPVKALAWGVLIGGAIQAIALIPVLKYYGWLITPKLKTSIREVGGVIFKTLPGIIGVSIGQLGLMVDVILASFLPAGAISWLFYSDRLVSIPLGIIGVAISSAILPYLARAKQEKQYQQTFATGFRWVLLLGCPAAVGLIMLAGPITATVYQTGRFTLHDVQQAQACLAAFAYALPALMIVKVIAAALNARQQFFLPCILTLMSLMLNILLGWYWLPHYQQLGLAYATSIAIWLNALLMVICALKQIGNAWLLENKGFIWRLLLALAAMVGWLSYWSDTVSLWIYASYFTRWLYILLLISSVILIFSGVLWLSGVRKHHLTGEL